MVLIAADGPDCVGTLTSDHSESQCEHALAGSAALATASPPPDLASLVRTLTQVGERLAATRTTERAVLNNPGRRRQVVAVIYKWLDESV